MPVAAAVQQILSSDVSYAKFAPRIASGDHLAFEVHAASMDNVGTERENIIQSGDHSVARSTYSALSTQW
jgi:hypothetical protein